MKEVDVLKFAKETGALLEGHFLLRSGLHSKQFFQGALLLSDVEATQDVCSVLADRFKETECATVISPAIGGIVAGYEVARQLGKRAIFAEKTEDDDLCLRRGFKIAKGEKVLVIEDVITRGGRVQQTIDLVRREGGIVVGVGVIVDRSGGKATFDVPVLESLIELQIETFSPDECPMCAAGSVAYKHGS
ncbi:MAG: orotate phosphoribosyltransferase [Lentisphaeria bacterium]|nr:orotate phosphoribosyltransferase [Lentisphaeria bacterium]